jgi:predicted RNase H-like HicB family nuclease
MERYTVRYQRDSSGWWVVTIPEVRGCRTQGRSIAEGRRRIREALGLFVGDDGAAAAELRDDVRLPAGIRDTLRRAERVRAVAARTHAEAQEATREAVGELVGRVGLSVRDVAEVLGISHQRVQQLAGRR